MNYFGLATLISSIGSAIAAIIAAWKSGSANRNAAQANTQSTATKQLLSDHIETLKPVIQQLSAQNNSIPSKSL